MARRRRAWGATRGEINRCRRSCALGLVAIVCGRRESRSAVSRNKHSRRVLSSRTADGCAGARYSAKMLGLGRARKPGYVGLAGVVEQFDLAVGTLARDAGNERIDALSGGTLHGDNRFAMLQNTADSSKDGAPGIEAKKIGAGCFDCHRGVTFQERSKTRGAGE